MTSYWKIFTFAKNSEEHEDDICRQPKCTWLAGVLVSIWRLNLELIERPCDLSTASKIIMTLYRSFLTNIFWEEKICQFCVGNKFQQKKFKSLNIKVSKSQL